MDHVGAGLGLRARALLDVEINAVDVVLVEPAGDLAPISPIFYEQLFCAKVFLRNVYVLIICVCNFLAKGFWRKSCS